MLLQRFEPSLKTPWHWIYNRKIQHWSYPCPWKSDSAYLSLWHGCYSHIFFCSAANFPKMPLTSMTHVGRARGESSNVETTGTDRMTDMTGSSSHGMWAEQKPLALAVPWQRYPATISWHKRVIGGSSGRSHLQGIFLKTVLHMKRWNRSA